MTQHKTAFRTELFGIKRFTAISLTQITETKFQFSRSLPLIVWFTVAAEAATTIVTILIN